jgi:hypothetical protein
MGATCPCGRPARRKYCSERCASRYYARSWRAKNAARNAAYQKAYREQWASKNKAKFVAYQKKYRAGRGKGLSTKWYRANRAEVIARRRDAYRERNAEFRAKGLCSVTPVCNETCCNETKPLPRPGVVGQFE